MKTTAAKQEYGQKILFKTLFFSLLFAYCAYYAPYGINETDGGFITGLAWQIMQGKMLYGDILYVRPPLPVLLRAVELLILPDHWTLIGERWIFYFKIAAYSFLGASLLYRDHRRWILAVFGFVVSAHCYPPMAWHTVDGILFSVAGIWCLANFPSCRGAAVAATAVFAAMLCKQSFYLVFFLFFTLLLIERNNKRAGWGIGVFFFWVALFCAYLAYRGIGSGYIQMTGGAASGSQAIRHGLFDYFRIKPWIALPSLPLLLPAVWCFWKKKPARAAGGAWNTWLILLPAAFAVEIWQRREFTVPFAQTRMMFWVGALYVAFLLREHKHLKFNQLNPEIRYLIALMVISWCASVSWGYNLPVLFSTPWVFAAMEISRFFRPGASHITGYKRNTLIQTCTMLLILVLVFRWGYEFVYRDGRRSDMDVDMGTVFPQLGGILSEPETLRLYTDLKDLATRYPNFKTLPSFPAANYLTRTSPPLPLDWVVDREMNGDDSMVLESLKRNQPVLLIEKRYANQIWTDPEMKLTRQLLRNGLVTGETPYFWIVKSK